MGWLFLAGLLLGQDPARPESFELSILRSPGKPETRGYVVGGTPFHLRIVALGKDGKPLASFAGTAEVSNLVRVDRSKGETPVGSAGPFQNGEFVLENVHLRGDAVTVRSGEARKEWAPRVLPGWLSILPPLVAIVLSVVTRQVLVALLAGIWAGVTLVYDYNPLAALLRMFDTNLLNALAEPSHQSILIFTVALGGMVGVVGRTGGAKALVQLLTRRARTRRSGLVSTWLMGVVVFFDDYANCLLVGNVARPFTDSQRISREKLSFLVDTTAAPMASLAFVSTWIGYLLGQFEATGHIPASETYSYFLSSWPYSFYCIFALFFAFLVCVTERDFGPMLRAERRAVESGEVIRAGAMPLADRELTNIPIPEENKLRWWNAAVPVGSVIAILLAGLVADGLRKADPAALEAQASLVGRLRMLIGSADSYAVLTWAAFGGGLVAVLLAVASRTLTLQETLDAWVTGGKSMVMAILILALAWTIGDLCKTHLETGKWVISLVRPSPHFLPLIVFLASCVIAFATGTSYGTMAIVFPIAGPMAWALTGEGSALSPALADQIRYATLGSVLTGAVFGDHCSPISDTTVMASMASAADHLDHVRTQTPYALVCATVAAVVGFIPAGFGFPVWLSLPLGMATLVGVIFLAGRKPMTM
jgi:Na+/H+ antiporter NhaC